MTASDTKPYEVSCAERVSRTLSGYSDNEVAAVIDCLVTELDPHDMLGIHNDGTRRHIIQRMSSGHYAYYVQASASDTQEPASFTPHYCLTFVLNVSCINAALARMKINNSALPG